MESDWKVGNCSACTLDSLVQFQGLQVLSLTMYSYRIKHLCYLPGELPHLIALHLESSMTMYEKCDFDFRKSTRGCIFPRVRELALEGSLPHNLILESVGTMVTHLTIIEDEKWGGYFTDVLNIKGRKKFPYLIEVNCPINIRRLEKPFKDLVVETRCLQRKIHNVGPRFFNYEIKPESVYVHILLGN